MTGEEGREYWGELQGDICSYIRARHPLEQPVCNTTLDEASLGKRYIKRERDTHK